MSGTRKAKEGAPLRQEKWASSAALPKGLLGNMVAKRCAAIVDPEFRKLIYFLHEVSLRGNTPLHPTCNLFPGWPWESALKTPESPLERVARELMDASSSRVEGKPKKGVETLRKALPDALARLCLDPGVSRESADLLAPGFRGLVGALLEYQAQFFGAVRGRVAETETFRVVRETLDYALGQRGMVLAEGTYRTGKSFSAQAWCQQHLGEARYVQLTAGEDQTGFFRDLAKALGVSSSAQMKAVQMRARVEDALCTQHLLLVVDEADWLWPQGRARGAPDRVNWIMTALVNKGVPVALIASRNFARMLANFERNCPTWGAEQFYGRLRLRRQLPDSLSAADLMAVAELMMPEADRETVMLLAGHALRSKGHVAAIETAVSRARFYASQEDRNAEFEDVDRIVEESAGHAPRSPRETPAATPPPAWPPSPKPAMPAAGGPRQKERGELAEDPLSRIPEHFGPVPIAPGMFSGSRAAP